MEGMIGEIRMFGGNFAPRAWALCEGQLLPIASNTALFSILGTTYGGDGRTTFALPDLRGRVAIQPGNGPGLSSYRLGEKGGRENVTLNITNLPSHNHSASGKLKVNNATGNTNDPTNGYPSALSGRDSSSGSQVQVTGYTTAANGFGAANGVEITVGNSGGNQSFSIMNPFLCVNFIICMQGVFPSRS